MRVWWRMPGTSEATKDSPSPTPMTTGGPGARGDDLVGLGGGEDAEGEGSGEALDGAADGVFEKNGRAGGLGVLLHLLDEVGDDFGVGFGDELVALRGEFALEVEVVFDDAVVDDDDAAGAVAVGVGVLFGGAAVGGPAGVADAEGAVEGMVAQDFFEIAELAGGAADFEESGVGAADGDAGRVVAAVFEAAQALDDDGDDFLTADVANNSAHDWILCEASRDRRVARSVNAPRSKAERDRSIPLCGM